MDSKHLVDNQIRRLFKLPGNRENLKLLYKSLSTPTKGLSLCRVQPEEQAGIFGFFAQGSLSDRIHMIDMANPPHGPMELQQTIIDTYDKHGRKKNIFFIYNIEGSIRLLQTSENEFFKGMNLIRDFFMQFEAEFVFFVGESLVKTIIGSAFDFYDWMTLTFIFVPESKEISMQPVDPGERKEIEYSHPLEKIKYLEKTIKKVKNEKARSMNLLELGKLYFQIGDYDNALKKYTESLEIEARHEDSSSMANLYNQIALIHKAKGNTDTALEFFTKAAKIFGENNDHKNLELVRTNMAGIHQTGPTENQGFNWDELLRRIKYQNIIPVIGQGLYRVDTEASAESGALLYDYLAEKIATQCGSTLSPDENHKFQKACLAFLKTSNNDYVQLSDLLRETLKEIRLVPGNSLWKLARIKAFNIFITTAYDDLLVNTLKNVRDIPTEVSYFSLREKRTDPFNNDLFAAIRDSKGTLVYHIFGNLNTMIPAYTENDIMETLLEFQKDTARFPENILFQVLKAKSLLFLGGGFDDWLYRFFIRSISNKPFKTMMYKPTYNYVADDFRTYKKDPYQELTRFLRDYDTEVFYTGSSGNFVDLLFEKLEETYPEEIIKPADFPAVAFISFDGSNKKEALHLADRLRKDGIRVWLDEMKLFGGDITTENILEAIDQCPVFIPLISQNSRQILTGNKMLKYHIKEWERAYLKYASDKRITIIPVTIDKTDWMYDPFKDFSSYRIPGGSTDGDYEKLRNRLRDIQNGLD